MAIDTTTNMTTDSDAAPYSEQAIARFWAKVDTSGGAEACWIWRAAHSSNGFGLFAASAADNLVYSHKFSYLLAHGGVPADKRLIQVCFNRLCVNPDHVQAVSTIEHRRHNVEWRKRQQPRYTPDPVEQPTSDADADADEVEADEEADEPDDEIDEPDDEIDEPDTRPFDAALFPDALFEHVTFVPDDGYIDEQYNLLNDSVRRYLLANRLDDLGHIACLATVYGHWMKCSPVTGQWWIYHRYAWHAVHERIVCRLVQVVLRLRLHAIRSPESHFAERERKLATRALVQTHNSVERLVIIARLAQGLVSGELRAVDEFD